MSTEVTKIVFEKLNPNIYKILKQFGIKEATEPQKLSIPYILDGRNILLIAPTGIGKTEAAMLPIFSNHLKNNYGKISILYITPLRALNRDMLKRMKQWGEKLGIDIAVRHGDTTQKERVRQSKSPPDMLITTPETLQIMFTGKRLIEHLKNIKWVVIDEVHELANNERGAQLSIALERLYKIAGDFQRIGLSATIGNEKDVGNYVSGIGRDIKIIKATSSKEFSINIESPIPVKKDDILTQLIHADKKSVACLRRSRELIEKHRSTLFFINTRDGAEALASRFRIWDEDFKIGIHHGSLSKNVRIQMEEEFKTEILKSLICTSSLELGIDIGSADFTIQYNSPREVTRLIQRIGRSGHKIGKISEGTIIATSPDDIAESCVIAKRTINEQLEGLRIRENPLDVLANQIIAYSMSQGKSSIEDCYKTIIKAYPFRNLKKSDFLRVMDLLREEHILWVKDIEFGKKMNTFKYFYDNISMIPDEKIYKVIDITTRSFVATLDEAFVASYAKENPRFIVKGTSWHIVEIKENEILVEPIRDMGAIPSWVGEEIPVPFEVAQEVGKFRNKVENIIKKNQNNKKINPIKIKELAKEYLTNQKTMNIFIEHIKEQNGYLISIDNLITIERGKKLVIINACFGNRVNDTIGRLISGLLTARIGESIGIQIDPYRIILESGNQIDAKLIKKFFYETKPENIEGILRIMLRNSQYIKWQLLHTAKKFGAIEKGADYKVISIRKIFDLFKDTPLFEEAIEKVLWNKMDINTTKKVFQDIQNGKIEVEFEKLSPIGMAGLEAKKKLITAEKADRQILLAMKERLLNQEIRLLCLNCGHSRRTMVKELNKITCHMCESIMLAAVKNWDKESIDVVKKKEFSNSEIKIYKRLQKNASLVASYGKNAVITLQGRGVGVDTAGRILAKQHDNEEDFLRDILKSEVNFARTKRFWD